MYVPNGSAGEPWPAGPSVPSAGSTAAGGRNQRGSPADPFARPSAVGRTFRVSGVRVRLNPIVISYLSRSPVGDFFHMDATTLSETTSAVSKPPVADQL